MSVSMLRKILAVLVIPLLLLAPGVCVCGAQSLRGPTPAKADARPETDSQRKAKKHSCRHHRDTQDQQAPSRPADCPDQHAPSCPALKMVVGQAVPEQARPALSMPLADVVLLPVISSTPPRERSAESPQGFSSPDRPLFLMLRALLI